MDEHEVIDEDIENNRKRKLFLLRPISIPINSIVTLSMTVIIYV